MRSGRGQSGQGGRQVRSVEGRLAFFLLAVVALVGGVTWALLGSSLFVVRSVQVYNAGNSRLGLAGFAAMPMPRDQVLVATGIKKGTPLIRVDTGAVPASGGRDHRGPVGHRAPVVARCGGDLGRAQDAGVHRSGQPGL